MAPHLNEHVLTIYIRTKRRMKERLKDLHTYDTVKLYVYELEKLGCNHGPLLVHLKNMGEIWYDNKGNFKELREGRTDPSLLDITKRKGKVTVKLDALHLWMREVLRHVKLVDMKRLDIPVYFKEFLTHRNKSLHSFFSVDSFSGRVHSPVVNLKGEMRSSLRLHNEKLVSLDVKQMQPTILAKVLRDSLGKNSFSDAIFNGEDVYVHLQRASKLPSRKDAKKYLFQLIFGKPMNDIGKMFEGDTSWVDWINDYKSKVEMKNPHKDRTHTNLAWLLQFSEVKVMTGIWQRLKDEDIPFLTIHDELLCRVSDKDRVFSVMDEELKKHFEFFTINVVCL